MRHSLNTAWSTRGTSPLGRSPDPTVGLAVRACSIAPKLHEIAEPPAGGCCLLGGEYATARLRRSQASVAVGARWIR